MNLHSSEDARRRAHIHKYKYIHNTKKYNDWNITNNGYKYKEIQEYSAGCRQACPYSQIQDGKTTNIFTNTKKYKIGKLQIMNTNTKKYRNTVLGASGRAHIHKYKMGKLQIYSQIQRNTRLENYKQLQLKMPTTASGSPSFITSPKVGKVSQKMHGKTQVRSVE